ncbi:Gibberellin 2-beta-dioxygenase 8 [Morus notabilis]|uniref:gibberellin 2beta-dioxygenase n=1 Tax=Morus notabilis TaxID=981085 RepID=W9SYI1_9ROSA|nr:gibberellin 2-beta-dioxygenase 8 [Morus notabilis]EXC33074.1 Gibberellin 2-beta-dioxygenase 8 [Morus notabilis]
MIIDSNPPLLDHYKALLDHSSTLQTAECDGHFDGVAAEECQLPMIDLNGLKSDEALERVECAKAISKAASEWGFFQVVNHGISLELVKKMRKEQTKLFEAPFEDKATSRLLNNSYRWGTPTATRPSQFSWSEAFHIPLTKVSEEDCYGDFISLREPTEEFAAAMSKLARSLAGVLAENLGHRRQVFEEICDESTCFLRLNRYPACAVSSEIFGLVPHTDSGFLTILRQDHVGGLQLMKDYKWVSVKPNPEALIVNIGDLFQAWSNDVFKSVEHRVMTNKMERYSIAYFLCPSYDSLIGSCREPSVYRKFTFRQYRSQVQEDVKKMGYKVGLSRFLLQDESTHTTLKAMKTM